MITIGYVQPARSVVDQASASTIDSVPDARSVVDQASASTIGYVRPARSVVEEASVSTIGSVPTARSVEDSLDREKSVYERLKAQAHGPAKNPTKNFDSNH